MREHTLVVVVGGPENPVSPGTPCAVRLPTELRGKASLPPGWEASLQRPWVAAWQTATQFQLEGSWQQVHQIGKGML